MDPLADDTAWLIAEKRADEAYERGESQWTVTLTATLADEGTARDLAAFLRRCSENLVPPVVISVASS